MPTNHLNALVVLTFVGLAGMTGSAAAQFSFQFDLDGDIATPGIYNYASLSAPALPPTTEKVTYMAGMSTVMDTFTGTGLWTLLQSAGGVKPIPGVKKNSSLLNYVVAVGSDGYQAVFSGGEINPMFGGSTKAPDMVAYSDTNDQLGPNGSDGFARLVAPGCGGLSLVGSSFPWGGALPGSLSDAPVLVNRHTAARPPSTNRLTPLM